MFKVTVQLVGDNRPEDVRAVHELFKLALRTKIGHDAIRSFMTTTLTEMWTTHSGSHRKDQACGSRCPGQENFQKCILAGNFKEKCI